MGYAREVDPSYLLIVAAKYLGVPPWELAKQDFRWYRLALASLSAENMAQKLQQEIAAANKG